MREMGVRGLLIYCADYRCSHSIAISGDTWPDDARLSDIEERFTCRVCGKRGADVRPDFNRTKADDGLLGRVERLPIRFSSNVHPHNVDKTELYPVDYHPDIVAFAFFKPLHDELHGLRAALKFTRLLPRSDLPSAD
jgi:hypothetical protein